MKLTPSQVIYLEDFVAGVYDDLILNPQSLDIAVKKSIIRAVLEYDDNISKAARSLNVMRATIYKHLTAVLAANLDGNASPAVCHARRNLV